MKIPDKIICTNQSYSIGAKSNIELPLKDIKKFHLFHKSGCNGSLIQVCIKEELLTSMDPIRKKDGTYDIENKCKEYGIYKRKYDMGTLIMRTKDMPKFSKYLRKLFSERKIKKEKTGINAGTRYVQSYTRIWKEIFIEDLTNGRNKKSN